LASCLDIGFGNRRTLGDSEEECVRKLFGLILALGLLTLATGAFTAEEPSPIPGVPVKGMLTMVDLGADKCIPCKMMAPVLRDLQKEYEGKAAILFIDIWKYPKELGKFRVSTIPTQIFYDKEGKEIYRHEGFLAKEGILDVLKKAGVPIIESTEPSDAGRN
jgi:thioredoxin 1